MGNTKKSGAEGENAAAAFLEQRGVRILMRNYRCPFGEIDLIGKEQDYYLFIEVKRRNQLTKGTPAEAVDARKQRKICRTADYFRMKFHFGDDISVRFDVIEVNRQLTCRWLKNAFEYQGGD